jgi:hypothetical protein
MGALSKRRSLRGEPVAVAEVGARTCSPNVGVLLRPVAAVTCIGGVGFAAFVLRAPLDYRAGWAPRLRSMEFAPWVPGHHGKGLLVRPRKDRVEDYTLITFSDRWWHDRVVRDLGVAKRVVAYLLIWPDGGYEAIERPGDVVDLAALIGRLDGRLNHRNPNVWDFSAG